MQPLPLPTRISILADKHNASRITIEPCAPGYGTTIGNALRRVLLSSLPGAAATSVKIKGATHEFSTLPHIKEDVVEIILNIKNIRFVLHDSAQSTMTLKVKGEKLVTAKDLSGPADVEVVSPQAKIATLTDKNAELEMDITIQEGRGYVPIEASEKKVFEHGVIALDALYSPVKNANFVVENVRVGQMTNFDKVTLTVVTDGSLSPLEAVQQASHILIDHFKFITEYSAQDSERPSSQKRKVSSEEVEDGRPETTATEVQPEKKEKKKPSKSKKESK